MALGETLLIAGAAASAALLICSYLLFAAMVALFQLRIQPFFWLFGRSRPAIRAILHLAALLIAAIGIPLGFLIGRNWGLAVCTSIAFVISFGAEWTFMGDWGPLARLLRSRDQQYLRDMGRTDD